MENRAHALAAGLFVILLGCATAFALWWLGQSNEAEDRYVLETRGNVNGLNQQAAVRYRGIRAGKVESIGTDPADARVLQVRISLDSRFKLTRATTATLGYQGVTGLAYISLEDDGSSPEPLKVGAGGTAPRIPMKPSLLETLGDKAGRAVGQVTEVSGRLAGVLDERNVRNLARTLENAAAASEGLRELPAVVAGLRSAVSAANLQRLERILTQVEKTAGEAAPAGAELRNLLRSMNELTQKLDRMAVRGSALGEEFGESTLPGATATLRELQASARQMNRLLDALEAQPEMLLFGRQPARPGPGESGFAPAEKVEKAEK